MEVVTVKPEIKRLLTEWVGKHVSILWESENGRFGIDGILERDGHDYGNSWFFIAYRDPSNTHLGALGQFKAAGVFWVFPEAWCIGLSKAHDWMVLKHAQEYRNAKDDAVCTCPCLDCQELKHCGGAYNDDETGATIGECRAAVVDDQPVDDAWVPDEDEAS